MTVRLATPDDAIAITAIINRVIADTIVTFTSTLKTPSDIAAQIKDGRPYFVWTLGDDVLGYSSYGPFRAGDGYDRTVEYGIAVDPAAQGQGAGRALLQAVSVHAKDAGKTTLIAGISADNSDGVAFHTAMGFEQTGMLPGVGHKFGKPRDLVIAQKRL